MVSLDLLAKQIPLLGEASVAPATRAAAVADPTYWRKLCPDLHVDARDWGLPRIVIDPDPDLVDECRLRMNRDGYYDIASEAIREDTGKAYLDWAVNIASMADGIKRIVAAGWPPSFLLM